MELSELSSKVSYIGLQNTDGPAIKPAIIISGPDTTLPRSNFEQRARDNNSN